MAEINARQKLNQWAQRHKGCSPEFSFLVPDAVHGQHACSLRIRLPPTYKAFVFQASARTKKDAQEECALQVLEAINNPSASRHISIMPKEPAGDTAVADSTPPLPRPDQPAPAPTTANEAATSALSKALKVKGFRAQAQQAKGLWQGWCPLSLLLEYGKPLGTWLKANEADASKSGPNSALLTLMAAQRLRQNQASNTQPGSRESQLSDPAEAAIGKVSPLAAVDVVASSPSAASNNPAVPASFVVCPSGLAFQPPDTPSGGDVPPRLAADEPIAVAGGAAGFGSSQQQGEPERTTAPASGAGVAVAAGPALTRSHQGSEANTSICADPDQVVAVMALPLSSVLAGGPAVQEVRLVTGESTLLGQVAQLLLASEDATSGAQGQSCKGPSATAGAEGAPNKVCRTEHHSSPAASGPPTAEAAGSGRVPEACQRLVCWGSVGVKWAKLPDDAPSCEGPFSESSNQKAEGADDMMEASACVEGKQQEAQGNEEDVASLAGDVAPTEDGISKLLVSENGPHMYSLLPRSALSMPTAPNTTELLASQRSEAYNPLASWMAGVPVHGPALMTACKPNTTRTAPPSAASGGVPSPYVWSSFGAADLWRACGARTATAAYASMGRMYMARLPDSFPGTGSWSGILPKALLASYCQRTMPGCIPTYTRTTLSTGESQQADQEAEGELAGSKGKVSLQLSKCHGLSPAAVHIAVTSSPGQSSGAHDRHAATGLDVDVEVSSYSPRQVEESDWVIGEHQAALAMLRHLEHADLGVLQQLAGEVNHDAANSAASQFHTTREVIDLGTNMIQEVQAGKRVRVSYKLWQQASAASGCFTGAEATAMDQDSRYILVEDVKNHRILVGNGDVHPSLQQLVMGLGVGGRARCKISIPLGGPDPLGLLPVGHGVLEASVLNISIPTAGASGGGPKLFEPSLSVQRRQFVEEILRQQGVRSLLDAGCGEGSLIQHLLHCRINSNISGLDAAEAAPVATVDSAGAAGLDTDASGETAAALLPPTGAATMSGSLHLDTIVGVDISERALKSAVKMLNNIQSQSTPEGPSGAQQPRLAQELAASASAESEAPSSASAAGVAPASSSAAQGEVKLGTKVILLQGSCFTPELKRPAAWGDLHGIDAAVMVEVIEHLDPAPLELVGPCLLGGLQPHLVIISTPNWDYNQVMRAVEHGAGRYSKWPGPPGRDGQALRCNDHRFEWTQEEFASWAERAAGAYGYTVQVRTVGQAIGADPGLSAGKGRATQVAVFKKEASATESTQEEKPSLPQNLKRTAEFYAQRA